MLDPDPRGEAGGDRWCTAKRVQSDRLKDILLAIAFDPKTSGEEGSRAVFAVEGFALNWSGLEMYRQAAKLGGAGEGSRPRH